jgi:hypothetical protein
MFDSENDRPLTEAQWEARFRESDLKAAKYQELLETLRDEPDSDLIIAREMGWTWLVRALEERAAGSGDAELDDSKPSDEADRRNHFVEFDDDDDGFDESWLEESLFDADCEDNDDADGTEPWNERCDELNRIPAYRAASALADRIADVLCPLMEGEDPDEDRSRLLGEAYISAYEAAVKIAGGDAMGYDDDMLCGNIVNNRIALDAVHRCQQAWAELQEQQIVCREVAEPLLSEMREVQKLIEERIVELRSRVWW